MNRKRTDRVWKALSDGTRRRMIDLLSVRRRSTSQLVAAFPKLSRFAVMKHLGVLNRAGLLIVEREGRRRWNMLNPVPLREIFRRWVGQNESNWSDAVLNIRDAAEAAADSTTEGDAS